MTRHGKIFSYLETCESWKQEEHSTIENLPQQIPTDICKHEKVEIPW